MAQFKIDLWNAAQLSRLSDFFANEAKPGDSVIFDRKLAEMNAPASEGLDDKGCNSWVYRVANQALSGFDDQTVRSLADTITLTTAYLHHSYPEYAMQQQTPSVRAQDISEDDLELDLFEDDDVEPVADQKATQEEEWAQIVRRYTSREPAI